MLTTKEWLEVLSIDGKNYDKIVKAIHSAAAASEQAPAEGQVIRVAVKEDGTPYIHWAWPSTFTPDEMVVAEFAAVGHEWMYDANGGNGFDAGEHMIEFLEGLERKLQDKEEAQRLTKRWYSGSIK